MKNVACRIFKEQIELINELPKEDRANVLYSAIMNAYNQFENQNEIQTENQIEYAYISLSISKSISKSIFNLLSKNIVFKEYNNYGGKRENSGRPKTKKRGQVDKQDDCQVVDKDKRFKKPLLEEIREYCKERNNTVDCERFFDFYESKGWKVGNQPMKDWKAAVRNWEKSSKPKQKTLYEKCVENGLKFLEDTDD